MSAKRRRLCVAFACCLVAHQARADYVSSVLDDNPVGYWRLGEGVAETTALDSSPLENDMPFNPGNSAQHPTPGAAGGPGFGGDTAYSFDGVDDVLYTYDDDEYEFASGQSFSIELWMNTTQSTTTNVGVLSKGYDSTAQAKPWYLMRLGGTDPGNGIIDLFLRSDGNVDNSVKSTTAVNDGAWHHVVGVYDSTAAELRMYVDGVRENTTAGVAADAYGPTGRPLLLGRHYNRHYQGLFDEVAVYGAALTDLQIDEHHYLGSGNLPAPPGPVQVQTTNAGAADQAGWFQANADAPAITQTIYGGDFDGVTVTATGTHIRSNGQDAGTYAAVNHTDGDLDNLLSGGLLTNDHAANITLSLTGLADGDYSITTYHHTPYTRTNAVNFDVLLTDGNGTDVPTYTGVAHSYGASVTSEALGTVTTPFTVSGGSLTMLTFDPQQAGFDPGGADHLNLNGFQLERLIQTETVLAIDFLDRPKNSAVDPSPVEAGFEGFLLSGTDPLDQNEVATATTRAYGDLSVTVSGRNGLGVGDRRRDAPNNGGLFNEQELLKDVLFFRGTTPDDGCDVLVEGLQANTEYLVTLWSFDDGSPVTRTSDWFANGELVKSDYQFDGAAVPPAPGSNGTYSFDFPATTDENGELLVSGRVDGPIGVNPHVFLNAMTIVRVVPEPSGVVLLLLAVAALVPMAGRRRR